MQYKNKIKSINVWENEFKDTKKEKMKQMLLIEKYKIS